MRQTGGIEGGASCNLYEVANVPVKQVTGTVVRRVGSRCLNSVAVEAVGLLDPFRVRATLP